LRKRIQAETQVKIVDRGASVVVIGDDEEALIVGDMLAELLQAVRGGHTPTLADLNFALDEARQGRVLNLSQLLLDRHAALRQDIRIRARTHGQKHYLDTIKARDITLAIGPAGTGKTYLAMAAAVSALLNKEVKRLILTRPAVEAGESLGFLPGDLEQKVNPYLRPLFDALYSMVDLDRVRRWIEQERIEVAPLAYMRGRTLDQSFAILDEAQNTTTEQMMMFLTRLGQGSRAVITGDITQVDLPRGTRSGLVEAQRILQNIPGIGVVQLDRHDVVRNPLVQRIIDAYEAEKQLQELASRPGPAAEGGTPSS
jgi:phosphate starvation-inducible PhoH-like protein